MRRGRLGARTKSMRGIKVNRMGYPTDQPSMMTRYRLIFPVATWLHTLSVTAPQLCSEAAQPGSVASSVARRTHKSGTTGTLGASQNRTWWSRSRRGEASRAVRSRQAYGQRTENLVRAGERPRWRSPTRRRQETGSSAKERKNLNTSGRG